FGVLGIYSCEADAFNPGEVEILKELANDLAYGISALRSRTKQEKAEEALRELSTYNRSLIEASIDPLVMISCDGKILDANIATEKTTGMPRNELIGTDFSEYFTEPEKAREGYRLVFSQGKVLDYPLKIRHRDGHITPVLYNAAVYYDSDGNIKGVLAAARDITGRENAEEQLRRSEEKYRLLIENSHDIIYTITKEGIFTFVSPSWTALLGHPVDQVVGRPFQPFVHVDDLAGCLAFLQRTIETGQPQTGVEYRVRHADGSWRWHTSNAVPLLDETGAVIGGEGIASDITVQKQAKAALYEANRKLNLLSSMTRHDINNQTVALKGNLALLKLNHPELASNENLKTAERTAGQISAMIRFTKEYEDIGVHAPFWQDVRTLVRSGARNVLLESTAVVNEVPADTSVFADPLIVKVFHNLIHNAVRHGGKTTTIRFSLEERDGVRAIVCEDDGVGIPPDMKEKLFTKGIGKNHGFGLFLSREILAITDITITEASEPGKGAKFVMTPPQGGVRAT
ncbi:MAG: PAS domain S-box protein, partial [Methanomassiliicoccales archaeon]